MRIPMAAVAATFAMLAAGSALAQSPPGVVGPIKSVAGDDIVVATASGDVTVTLTPQSRIFQSRPITATDLKDGVYVGTTNKDAGEATGHATEVHVADGGPAFQAEWGAPGVMMTNGKVKSVTQTAKGQEFDVDYSTGVRHVVAAPGTPITRNVAADRSALKPGVSIRASVKDADGKKLVQYIGINPAPAK